MNNRERKNYAVFEVIATMMIILFVVFIFIKFLYF